MKKNLKFQNKKNQSRGWSVELENVQKCMKTPKQNFFLENLLLKFYYNLTLSKSELEQELLKFDKN